MLKVVSSSETLLMLADMDPNYVSQNEIDAQKECDIIFPLGFTSMSEEEAEAEMKLEGNLEEDDEELDLQSEATEATEASEVTRSQAENDTINSESDPKAEEQTVEEEKVDEDKVEEEKVKKPEIDQTHENITEEANIEGVNVIQANNANNESVEENGTEIKWFRINQIQMRKSAPSYFAIIWNRIVIQFHRPYSSIPKSFGFDIGFLFGNLVKKWKHKSNLLKVFHRNVIIDIFGAMKAYRLDSANFLTHYGLAFTCVMSQNEIISAFEWEYHFT